MLGGDTVLGDAVLGGDVVLGGDALYIAGGHGAEFLSFCLNGQVDDTWKYNNTYYTLYSP